jgi:hypothetical protein
VRWSARRHSPEAVRCPLSARSVSDFFSSEPRRRSRDWNRLDAKARLGLLCDCTRLATALTIARQKDSVRSGSVARVGQESAYLPTATTATQAT